MARILVVDDNETNLKLVSSILRYEGHVTFEAHDGHQGLTLARSETPALIIADVLMPTMDGYEFVRLLRADPQLAGIAVIFHTAHYLDQEAQRLAEGCQVEHVLPKPCDAAQLLSTVALVLSRTPAAMSLEATGQFDVEHRRLVSKMLLQKVEELQQEVEERKQAEAKVRQLNRVYAVLSGINSLIVRVASRDELCAESCRLAVEHGHFRVAWIGMRDPGGDVLVPMAWAGDSQDLRKSARISINSQDDDPGMIASAVRSGQPVVCNDLRSSPHSVRHREQLIARGYRSLVALPLIVSGTAVGCLTLVTDEAAFFSDDEMRLLLELSADISFALDHIQKAEKLDYLAYYDSLTGLANRSLFLERVNHFIADAARRNVELAVIVVALERFETINDTLGRHVTDRLLSQIGSRFVRAVGSRTWVARIGSDHFAAVIPEVIKDGEVLRELNAWWRQWLGTPFTVERDTILIQAKAGIALFPSDGATPEILLDRAEVALKEARASGKVHAFFTKDISDSRAEWLALEANLIRALEREEFVLYYQPKLDLTTRKLQGVEALIRWQSPELGLVPPVRFIPLMEETGMISEVGAWVMRQATLERSRWLEPGLDAPRIAVNVSTIQLAREDFVRTVATILKLAGSEAGMDIEVTESLLMQDVTKNIAKLVAIRELGVGIAIDDFGTGYSSLGYLAKLPVETLKIDRSFVSAMLDDPSAMTLVSTMISLAHALKLTVVAEGVESEEQAKFLRLLRCDQMQGYLISKPLPFDEMTAYLSRSRNSAPQSAL
jgi:diguanylate cyclase (GGDEF)-like protein